MTDGFILKCFTSKNGFVTCRAPILLVNLIDVTLACEDANSKLVEVVTVADVDDEKRFDDSFMQFWKLKFGHKAKFCSDFEHKVWPRV